MDIRKQWINFFNSHDHLNIEPKSLIPHNDKSLLWINSGVATIKDYFDGSKKPPHKNLTSIQRSIRTNDVTNVGVTSRHHTIFEMLGNFSIGGYFKKKAIEMGWEFLTSPKWLNFDKEKLYVTIFGEDKEAFKIWNEDIGVAKDHIIIGDKNTNFWDLGKGPCGPNTEIFYDRGKEFDPKNVGIKLLQDDLENDRYIEIWNIVFSQFNNDGNGNYTPLPIKNIDTGMGLERVVSILENGVTNFDTSLYLPIIKEIEKGSDTKYLVNEPTNSDKYINNTPFKIIADHFKTLLFATADGAAISNVGRGYILKWLLRRSFAAMDIIKFKPENIKNVFEAIVKVYGPFYKQLKDFKDIVEKVVLEELEKYNRAISTGEKHFHNLYEKEKKITEKDLFHLYETYGLPITYSGLLARKLGFDIDIDKIELEAERHREVSRSNSDVEGMQIQENLFDKGYDQKFVGYEKLKIDSEVVFSTKRNDGNFVTITKETPIYTESGGQATDEILVNNKSIIETYKNKFGDVAIVSKEELSGKITIEVKKDIRNKIMANHSATHLLAKCLNIVLGKDIKQMGSANNDQRLRFDYNGRSLNDKQIKQIEEEIEKRINQAAAVEIKEMSKDEAVKLGANAFFGDKYGDVVRVVKMSDSLELCGGTHVKNTKDIKSFAIISSVQKSAASARVIATTGQENFDNVFEEIKETFKNEISVATKKVKELKQQKIDVSKIEQLLDFDALKKKDKAFKFIQQHVEEANNLIRKIQKESESKQKAEFIAKYSDLSSIADKNLAVIKEPGINTKLAMDLLTKQENSDIIILLVDSQKPVMPFSLLTKKGNDITNIFNVLKSECNAQGGGNKNFFQGALIKGNNIDSALAKIKEIL